MGYYNGSRWTGSGGTWVQGVEHRVCDIQRVPPPARCTIDRRGSSGGDGGGRGVAKNARNVFTPTTAAILLPLLFYQLPLPLLPRYYHCMYTIPLPLLPRRRCCCCLCALPLCIRRKALVEYSRRRRGHRVRRESFEISAFVPQCIDTHERTLLFSIYTYIYVLYLFVKQYCNKISYGFYDRRTLSPMQIPSITET